MRWPSREDFFEALEIVADDFLDADEAGFDAIFGETEDDGLGAVENHVGVVAGGESLLLNFGGGVNQAAQDGFFFDDARVVLDVGDARQAVGELRNVGHAAGGFEFAAAVQVFHQRDDVDGLLLFAQLHHASKIWRC